VISRWKQITESQNEQRHQDKQRKEEQLKTLFVTVQKLRTNSVWELTFWHLFYSILLFKGKKINDGEFILMVTH
jgi:hypothetical protein